MQIQIRHTPFDLNVVNQGPINFLGSDTGPIVYKPDQFWILNNITGQECYSVGKYEDAQVPNSINGIATNVQERGGKWTYHGPGQVSFVVLINIKRLIRLVEEPDRPRSLVKIFKDCLEQLFGVELEYRDADPGLYFVGGAKVASFDTDVPAYGWMAVKLSINLNVDTAKFSAIDTCGVNNRDMGNLMPDHTITAELTTTTGETIARAVIADLYNSEAEILPWSEDQ